MQFNVLAVNSVRRLTIKQSIGPSGIYFGLTSE